ncbi:MAG TPA: lipopolysaccharide biosynthesis protein [Methyloceanibacter sp.]|nr:lipopolysaccharide biosynthesis protein [Methyloceanibacter sp.]
MTAAPAGGSGAGGFSLAGISVIGIRVLGAGLGFGAQALASRLIGADQFGYYALAFVWLILLGHGATAGTNQLICRFLATYRERGTKNPAAGLLRFAFLMAAVVAAVVAVAAIGVVQSGVFNVDAEFVVLASLTFCAIPLLVLQDFLEAIARGMDRPTLGIAPAMLMRQIALLAGAGTLLLLGADADALTVMMMTMAGLGASILIQVMLLWRPLRAELRGARPAYESAMWLRTALPVALLDATETLFNNADILILALFVPPEIVGFYYAATRLAQFLGYVPYGISAATAQKYAVLHERGDRKSLQQLISAATALSTALAVSGAIVLSVIGGYLLLVFGDNFDAAAPILPVLSLGIVFVCAFGPGEDVLTMLGHERVCSAIFFVFISVNVALNFILVPAFGMMGAAAATTIALGLRGGILAWIAHRRTGLYLPVSIARARAAWLDWRAAR